MDRTSPSVVPPWLWSHDRLCVFKRASSPDSSIHARVGRRARRGGGETRGSIIFCSLSAVWFPKLACLKAPATRARAPSCYLHAPRRRGRRAGADRSSVYSSVFNASRNKQIIIIKPIIIIEKACLSVNRMFMCSVSDASFLLHCYKKYASLFLKHICVGI